MLDILPGPGIVDSLEPVGTPEPVGILEPVGTLDYTVEACKMCCRSWPLFCDECDRRS